MFTPFKSIAIKFILSASILITGLSSCANEAIEETHDNAFINQSTESANLTKSFGDPTYNDLYDELDTVLYPIDLLDDKDKNNKNNKQSTTSRIDIDIVGSWDMTSLNEQNVDYNLILFKDGTFQLSPDEVYTRGRILGNWNIETNTEGKSYLYLNNFYDENEKNIFEITTFSVNELIIENNYNDSFVLSKDVK